MNPPLAGGCLCGAIRYTVSVPVTEARVCHCTHCQKASGAAGAVNAVIPSSTFAITQGRPRRYASKADSGRTLYRYFCGDCGSPIYSQRETAPETAVLRVGTLDLPEGLRITAHIWTKSARSWHHIDRKAKLFEGQP